MTRRITMGEAREIALETCQGQEQAHDEAALAAARGSALAETVERRMWVGLNAPGFTGRFELPEKHFNELLSWLVERSCGVKQEPNARTEAPRE